MVALTIHAQTWLLEKKQLILVSLFLLSLGKHSMMAMPWGNLASLMGEERRDRNWQGWRWSKRPTQSICPTEDQEMHPQKRNPGKHHLWTWAERLLRPPMDDSNLGPNFAGPRQVTRKPSLFNRDPVFSLCFQWLLGTSKILSQWLFPEKFTFPSLSPNLPPISSSLKMTITPASFCH